MPDKRAEHPVRVEMLKLAAAGADLRRMPAPELAQSLGIEPDAARYHRNALIRAGRL